MALERGAMGEKLLKVASVAAAHGLGGEVRLKVFLEDKEIFESLAPFWDVEGTELGAIEVRGRSKGQLIARLAGTNTRDAAEALKGLNLFIPRHRLPEPEGDDEFYYADLIGLPVRENGETIGTIKALHDHGGGDLLEIEFSNSKTDMFSFTRAIFPTINLIEGWISFVRPTEVISQDAKGGAR